MYINLFNINILISKKFKNFFQSVFPFILIKEKNIDFDFQMKVFHRSHINDLLRNTSSQIKSGFVKIEKENKIIKIFITQNVYFPEFFSRLLIFLIKSEGAFFKTILLHSASVLINNDIYLIPGLPSSGKTTLSKFLKKIFKKNAFIINDDLTLCSYNYEKKIFEVYGIPSINDLSCNNYFFKGPYPIKYILFPNINKKTYLKKLTPKKCYTEFLKDNAFIIGKDKNDLSHKIKYHNQFLKSFSKQVKSSLISYDVKKDKNFIKNVIK